MHGNHHHHHHHHHQRTDLGGIMSITSAFTIGPLFCAMHPLCKILNTPVMSICLVKQNDGTWVEKHQRFLFNVYKLFLFLSRFLTFFYFIFLDVFYIYGMSWFLLGSFTQRNNNNNRIIRIIMIYKINLPFAFDRPSYPVNKQQGK